MRYQKYSVGQIFLLILPALAAVGGCIVRVGPLYGIFPDTLLKDLTWFFITGLALCAIQLLWGFALHDMLLQKAVRKFVILCAVISVFCTLAANILFFYGFTADDPRLLLLPCAAIPVLFLITLLALFGVFPNATSQAELLRISTLPMRLLDKNGETVYASESAQPMDTSVKNAILSNRARDTAFSSGSYGLTVRPITDGWLLEEKDNHDRNLLQSDLDALELQLNDYKQAVLHREESISQLQKIRSSLPRLTGFFEPISELLRKASRLLKSAADSETPSGSAKLAYRAAMVYLAAAAGYAVLYRKKEDRLELSAYCSILNKPLQVVSAMGVGGSLRNISKGHCPFYSMALLYRIESDLIVSAMEQHWSDIGFQFRNDEHSLRAICAISGPKPEQFPDLIQEYQKHLPRSIGRLQGGNENGTLILYFTLWGRMDENEQVTEEEPVDIRTILNIPLNRDSSALHSAAEEEN